MLFLLLFGRGRVFFCSLGGDAGPAQTAKKKTTPPKQKKNKHAPAPCERVLFCCLGGWACLSFAVWAGGVFLFLMFGPGACFFFWLFGRGRVFFVAVWAVVFFFCCLGAGRVFFCCLGGGRVLFFAVWAGNGSSLTYLSAWLVFKRPNNKKDQTTKKKGSIHSALPEPCTKIQEAFLFSGTKGWGPSLEKCPAMTIKRHMWKNGKAHHRL